MPDIILDLIKLIYTISVLGMMIYGLASLALVLLFHFSPKTASVKPTRKDRSSLPHVTVQLPVYNEQYIMRRLLDKVACLDYPPDKLHIQVLDDSTDDTTRCLMPWISAYRAKGLDITCIHRDDRKGFKAGALRNGLATAQGEFIAIFDADFAPPKQWLLRTISAFDDPLIGCVQTRWVFSNTTQNTLTRTISLALHGHFMIEQSMRSLHHLFLGFNGTAGIWRRACIQDAGGWQDDTLTEDLDLSYRAQLRGWRIRFLPDITVPSILPDQLEFFKKQQYRWAKGSIQTAKKIYPKLMQAKIPEHIRLMGFIHLGGYAASLCMLLSFLTLIPLGVYAPSFFRLFPFTLVSSLGPPLLYLSTRTKDFPTLKSRLFTLPLLVLVGYGISLNNAIAVLDGMISKDVGDFFRTPKKDPSRRKKGVAANEYQLKISPMVIGEIILMLIAILGIQMLFPLIGWGIIPWLALYTAGYAYMAFGTLVQSINPVLSRTRTTAARQRSLH